LVKAAGASEEVIRLKALEAFSAAANGRATKIIIPSEIQGLAGLATSFKELLSDPEKPAPKKPETNAQ
ncbi:MAG: peptidase, partial [Firmicutes bacterium]|nr:peptidase [Bacillota bacterium]